MKSAKLIFLLSLMFANQSAHAQHEANKMEMHHVMKGAHQLTLGLGHTHISEGKVDDKTQWLALPSWSLNYEYWVSDKWAIGLQNDLIMESFIIENDNEELIERSYPVTVVPVAIFKPGKHLA
jgi:hypothetical protein